MLRLSPFWAPSSVICLMLVVPEVDTTVLPLRLRLKEDSTFSTVSGPSAGIRPSAVNIALPSVRPFT